MPPTRKPPDTLAGGWGGAKLGRGARRGAGTNSSAPEPARAITPLMPRVLGHGGRRRDHSSRTAKCECSGGSWRVGSSRLVYLCQPGRAAKLERSPAEL